MLNMAKAELEFISDADMCLFFEKDTRGEDSYISKRYRNVNNKCWKCDVKILLFNFSLYKMVDSEYSLENYKCSKMSIGTIIKNTGMLLTATKIKKCIIKLLIIRFMY